MRMKFITPVLSLAMALGMVSGTNACTLLYVGSNLTSDGHIIAGRSEDFAMAYPKTFDVNPAGAHKEGEEYQGCYGYTWTFTHDSYSYLAFSDDMSGGICPDCNGTHPHTPYQAAGTNEKGLTMTATETLYCKKEALAADPCLDHGIEEAELTTILLSEADSARGAVDLLISIIEEDGNAGGAGILFTDREESWYFESFTGTQYLAVQLNPDMVVISPNLSVMGRIDLDDTEHVIASDKLIETAVKAGTFVGDEDENVIDFTASFDDTLVESQTGRLCAGLNYLTGSDDYQAEGTTLSFESSAYTITNVDEKGDIVPLHTNISLAKDFDLEQSFEFYQISPIAKPNNNETHIFDIDPEDNTSTGIVEWISMADGRSNVLFPFYPMLTKEVSPLLCEGRGQAVPSDEKPDTPFCSTDGETYFSYPEQWDQTMYWVFSYLSGICSDDEDTAKAVRKQLDDLQSEVMDDWAAMQTDVASAGDKADTAATDDSIKITEKVHAKALAICLQFTDDTGANETESEA